MMRYVLMNKCVLWVLSISLFFCVHHYSGIVFDAILYLLQYVNSFDPARFFYDPAFHYGNQSSYGLFSPILGFFVNNFGVADGMKLLCFLMQFLWIIALVFFMKEMMRFLNTRLWTLPVILCFIVLYATGMPHSAVHFFKIVDTYTCSRMLSVALGIAGTAMLLKNLKWPSIALYFVGTVIHPLSAGWGIPLWLFYFYPKTLIPVACCSFLFPLSAFIGRGSLDLFPEDWLTRPLTFRPNVELVERYMVWFAFFYIACFKCVLKEKLIVLIKSLFVVLLIALYWNFWGGFGEHVFLYQVQTWRVEWLSIILIFPIYASLLITVLRRVRKNKIIYSHDLAIILIGVAMFSPYSLMLFAVVALVLLRLPSKKIEEFHIKYLLLGVSLCTMLLQEYLRLCLEGFPAIFGFDFLPMQRMLGSFFLIQGLVCVCLSILFFKQKQRILAFLLILYCIFPQMQLLPFAVLGMEYICNRFSRKIGCVLFVPIGILVVLDGVANISMRESNILSVFTKGQLTAILLLILCFFAIFLTSYLMNRLNSRKITFVPMILTCVFLCSYANAHYDIRSGVQKNAEKNVNRYIRYSIFPEISDRGKVLFIVESPYLSRPDLNFLTGTYLSETTEVGEIFFKGQYQEARRRLNLLMTKEKQNVNFVTDYVTAVSQMAQNPVLLEQKFHSLCAQDEIHHLISSEKLSFSPSSVEKYVDGRDVYLYACQGK